MAAGTTIAEAGYGLLVRGYGVGQLVGTRELFWRPLVATAASRLQSGHLTLLLLLLLTNRENWIDHLTSWLPTKTQTKTKAMTKTNTFREHLQRAIQETCDL